MIRLAIAGGGFGADHHWHEHPSCTVTAVADASEERRQALKDRYGCAEAFLSRERIARVSALGQLAGNDFPAGSENPYHNSFDNEMALGITDQGNICRFGVFWNIRAHGERAQWFGENMSCFMAGSGGQPPAMQKIGKQ